MWQLRLLLWKDFLLRKRKPVTVGAICWAGAALCALVIVRFNVDREPKDTCVFPARALPSAGLSESLQSLVCTVNNECGPIDRYEPIPSYKASRFKTYQEQILKLIDDPDVLDVGKAAPKAGRLLATIAKALHPAMLTKIIDDGLTVSDLFIKPKEAKRYLYSVLKDRVKGSDIDEIFKSKLNLGYIFELVTSGQLSCDKIIFNKLLEGSGSLYADNMGKAFCDMPEEEQQNVIKKLLFQMDIPKFTALVGDIFENLTGNRSLSDVSSMLGAAIRMMDLKNYWPSELKFIGPESDENFSYVQMDILSNFFESLDKILGSDPSFVSMKTTVNQLKGQLKTFNSLITKDDSDESNETYESKPYVSQVKKLLNVTISFAKSSTDSFNPTSIMEMLLNVVSKMLPEESRYNLFFTLTLVDKMMTLGKNIADKNIHMERLFQESCKRNPNALEVVGKLGPDVVARMLDALADPIRIQIFTRKIFRPGQMFCDSYKLQTFLKISKTEAARIKPLVCTPVWKSFVSDMVSTFGVNYASKLIDEMSSMVISNTLGNKVNDRFVKIEDAVDNFNSLIGFIKNSTASNQSTSAAQDWKSILPKAGFGEIEKVFKKERAWDVILVTTHTAVAREIISQSSVVENHLSPMLIKLWHALKALTVQVKKVPLSLVLDLQKIFPDMIKSVVLTLKNPTKSIGFVLADQEEIFCDAASKCETNECVLSSNVNKIVEYSSTTNMIQSTKVFCETFKSINTKLNSKLEEDVFLTTIQRIINGSLVVGKDEEVDWNSFIKNMQELYKEMSSRFGLFIKYISDNQNFKMMKADLNELKDIYFNKLEAKELVKFGSSVLMRILNTLNSPLFELKNHIPQWKSVVSRIPSMTGLVHTSSLFIHAIDGSMQEETVNKSTDLPLTTTKLNRAIFGSGELLDGVVANIIQNQIDWDSLMRDGWPCDFNKNERPFKDLSESAETALTSIKDLLCFTPEIYSEWQNYSYMKDLKELVTNTTAPAESSKLFLALGEKFNNFVDNISSFAKTIEGLVNNEILSNVVDSWRKTISVIENNHTAARDLMRIMDMSLQSKGKYKVDRNISTISLWEEAVACKENNCDEKIGTAIHYTFHCIAQAATEVVTYLSEYLVEVSDKNATVFELLGFTRRTGPHILYSKLPQIIHIVANSYLDHGFMKQIYTSIGKKFWDCERILDGLIIDENSGITRKEISLLKPYICPSILHWVSLPLNENALLDILAKSQYAYFGRSVSSFNATFEDLFNKSLILSNLTKTINFTDRNFNPFTDAWIEKIENITSIMAYGETERPENILKSTYIKESLNAIISARFTMQVKNIISEIKKTNISVNEKDLKSFTKFLDRKFSEINKIFIYSMMNDLKDNAIEPNLLKSVKQLCDDQTILKTNLWLEVNENTLIQFCNYNYSTYLEPISSINDQVKLLNNFITNIKDSANNKFGLNLTYEDIMEEALDYKKENVEPHLKRLYSYERELKVNGFLQYLDSIMQHRILQINFATGENWWNYLKEFYKGPLVTSLIEFMENTPDVVLNIINNLSMLRPIKLLKDINVDNMELLCSVNISEYIPDKANHIYNFKSKLCSTNITNIYRELKPLLFIAQIYDDDNFELDPYEGDQVISNTIENLEAKMIKLIEGEVKKPILPNWIHEDHIDSFNKLNVTEMKNEIINFVAHNFIDVVTLFINTTSTDIPSSITPWVKQINLQLIKSDEYTLLVCDMKHLNDYEVYTTLIESFHWDLALNEIASKRNYTWLQMNKALHEMIDIIKLYSQASYNRSYKKLQTCLFDFTLEKGDTQMNTAAIYLALGAKTMKIFQTFTPHIKNIRNVKANYKNHEILVNIMNSIPICIGLNNSFSNVTMIEGEIRKMNSGLSSDNVRLFIESKIDLNQLDKKSICDNLVSCTREFSSDDCSRINGISKIVNNTILQQNITILRENYFWEMKWLNEIASSFETIFTSFSRILIQINKINLNGVFEGEIEPTVDAVLLILNKNFLSEISKSLEEILKVLQPVLRESNIDADLSKLNYGLNGIISLKDNIISDLKLDGSMNVIFDDVGVLQQLTNNIINFSPSNIEQASLRLSPVLNSEKEFKGVKYHICNVDQLQEIFISSLSKTEIETLSSTLCNLNDSQAKDFATIVLNSLNSTFFTNILTEEILKIVMDASNLTVDEGKDVVKMMGKAIKLAPTLKESFENISQLLSNEPVLASLKTASDISSLMSKPSFLKDIGTMMCGKPFYTNVNRFYKAIAAAQDNVVKADPKQIKSLPSDYCKNLYKQIINMQAGKILWSYMKPLIMGKILYTPPLPQIENIIKNANGSFESVAGMTDLLKGLSESFDSLDIIKKYIPGLKNLQKLAKLPFLAKFLQFEGGDFNANDVNLDIEETLSQFNDEGLESLLRKASEITGCISLDRFVAIENEEKLELEALRLSKVNEFLIGIVFIPNESSKNLTYKIRMDIDNVPSTSRIKNQFWFPGPDGDFLENLRYFRGFIQIQDMVDKAIIETQSDHRIVKRDVDETKNHVYRTYTQQMPYPCWISDEFQRIMYESQALIIAFFFCLILSVSSISRNLVWEKESGNTDLMCIMGMKREWHTISWLISSLIEILMAMVVLCMVLKFGDILPKTNWFLLLLYLINFGISITAFSYMLTGIFKSASLAAVSGAILYLITFMPYILIISLEAGLSLPEKLLTSLPMSTGFCYGLLFIARFEVQGTGLQWNNVWISPQPGDPMSVGISILIVLFDTILYCVIGWLINHFRYRNVVTSGSVTNGKHFVVNNEVSIKGNLEIGVTIKNLSKTFNKTVKAVDNVSLELYKSQITTLLGHNGAGKTTLIKILTGVVQPDSGEIIMSKNESNKSRKNHIGLCPQSDVLLECLTAREHLSYYAQLKTGLKEEDIKDDIENMIMCLHLDDKLCNEPVYKLSGGTRRRLSVGLAFVTNPNLVILDEPSSGVDPVARRDIWSMICMLREGRTVLLTTHHLDEAELLSDTLLIMHHGKLCASGSPLELKHKYGDGYKLTVSYPIEIPMKYTFDENSPQIIDSGLPTDVSRLMNVVHKSVSNAKIVEIHHNDVDVNLPYVDEQSQSNNFQQLSLALENKQTELNFSYFSMECSSLEQVFIKICDSLNKNVSNNSIENTHRINVLPGNHIVLNSKLPDTKDPPKWHSIFPDNIKMLYQIRALLHKRYLHYRRNYWLLLNIFVLPVFFAAVAMGFSLIRPPADSENPLMMSSTLYSGHSAEFLSPLAMNRLPMNNSIMDIIINMEKIKGKKIEYWDEIENDCRCENNEQVCSKDPFYDIKNAESQLVGLSSPERIVDWSINTHSQYIEKRYGGWSFVNETNKDMYVMWYNNKGHHALPSYLNTLNNALYKKEANDNEAKITTYNHPLKLSPEQLSRSSLLQHVADVGISVILMLGFSLVPAATSNYLVPERTSQQKRLQLLSGVSPFTYWISCLLFDMGVIVIVIIETVCILEIFNLPVYVSRSNLISVVIIFFIYGFSSSSLVYILEKLFVDGSLANMIIFCICVFTATTGQAILLIIDVLSKSDLADDIRWYLHKVFLIWPQFALGDALAQLSANTIQADILKRFGMDTYKNPLTWKLMGMNCFALFMTTFLYFSINMLIEYKWFSWLSKRFIKKPIPQFERDEDEDVSKERERIEISTMKSYSNTVYSGSLPDVTVKNSDSMKCSSSDILKTVSLHKEYQNILGKKIAVENLTFRVKSGEVFGLLGINGAGKSTTFKMLTGEVLPSSGNIYINGELLKNNDLYNGLISYCPQNDALDPLVTLEEHLHFYCKLRNIKNEDAAIYESLQDFDLGKHTKQLASALSGGNKRKLCTAIALIGQAPLVLLDEPTSGMDPGARERAGLALTKASKSGRALLLSSHSLPQCERLCNKAALVHNGRMLAIGTPTHLKNRFGRGYIISIRLEDPEKMGELLYNLNEYLPDSTVQACHHSTLLILIGHKSTMPLSEIFAQLEFIKSIFPVSDYTLNQSSLDQVFVHFAQNKPNNAVERSSSISLSTLERQYSKPNLDSSVSNLVTKF